MMIKITLKLVIIAILLMNCTGTKEVALENNAPFTVTKSHFQKWVAGVQGGGSGVTVYFTIIDIEQDVDLQEVYFGNQQTKLTKKPNASSLFIGSFKDEARQDMIMDGESLSESQNSPPKKIPFQLAANEAIIKYIQNDKEKYFKVENMEEKPLIAYPSANPNE